MKLKFTIFIFAFLIAVGLGGILTVIVEHTMSLETKQAIEIAEREAQKERENQEKIEAEKLYEEEKKNQAKASYDEVFSYYSGVALVKKDNKYGYIDDMGNEVISLQYDMAESFSNKKFAKVMKDEKWGYIDTTGKEIIPIIYSYCGEISNNFVDVSDDSGKFGFVSITDGMEICELKYDKVESFGDNGLAKVILEQKYGYIDINGAEIVPVQNDYNEDIM